MFSGPGNVPYGAGGLVFAAGVLTNATQSSRSARMARSLIGIGFIYSGYLIEQGNTTGHYAASGLGALLVASTIRGAISMAPIPIILACAGTTVAIHQGQLVYREFNALKVAQKN